MGKIDLWSLITGVVSIASFMLAMWDRFPRLKQYLLPLGYILLGFTIGRISFVSNEAFVNIIKDTQVAGCLIIIILLFALCIFCFHFLMKKGQEMMAYMIIVVILLFVSPSLISSFSKATEKMPPKDYLTLSIAYEKENDYDEAIKYLNKYWDVIPDKEVKDQVKDKIAQLQQKRIESLK